MTDDLPERHCQRLPVHRQPHKFARGLTAYWCPGGAPPIRTGTPISGSSGYTTAQLLGFDAAPVPVSAGGETQADGETGEARPARWGVCSGCGAAAGPDCDCPPYREPDENDATEADIDRMMADGTPVQIVTGPPQTWTAPAAWAASLVALTPTGPPPGSGLVWCEEQDRYCPQGDGDCRDGCQRAADELVAEVFTDQRDNPPDQDGERWQSCRTSQHCATHGWCHRCAPNLWVRAKAMLRAVADAGVDEAGQGRVYAVIAEQLRLGQRDLIIRTEPAAEHAACCCPAPAAVDEYGHPGDCPGCDGPHGPHHSNERAWEVHENRRTLRAHRARTAPPAGLRAAIADALRTTPATGHTHTPGQERWDHHPKPGADGHRYTHTCALCVRDVGALTDAVTAVVTGHTVTVAGDLRTRVAELERDLEQLEERTVGDLNQKVIDLTRRAKQTEARVKELEATRDHLEGAVNRFRDRMEVAEVRQKRAEAAIARVRLLADQLDHGCYWTGSEPDIADRIRAALNDLPQKD